MAVPASLLFATHPIHTEAVSQRPFHFIVPIKYVEYIYLPDIEFQNSDYNTFVRV